MIFNFFLDTILHISIFVAIIFVLHSFYDYFKEQYTTKVNLNNLSSGVKEKLITIEKNEKEHEIIENDLTHFLESSILGENKNEKIE